MYVGVVIKRAAEVGMSRSQVAPRRPTGEKQLHPLSEKRLKTVKAEEAPVRASTEKGGDRDRFTCN